MKALILLPFDDGFRSQFEHALPVVDKYGMLATFFLIANTDATHEKWNGHTQDWWKIDWTKADIEMLKKVVKSGHEIGSHSVSHCQRTMRSQPQIEASDSKRLIEDWLGIEVSSFCYPFYRSHEYLADAVMKAGYEQARGGGAPPLYIPQASYHSLTNNAPFNRFNVDCREISENESVGEWIRSGALARFNLPWDRRGSGWMETDRGGAICNAYGRTRQTGRFWAGRDRHV